ncbi:uncharacterized protein LOC101854768 [Aplysia californica]|uniref:Uncharacterized protein LOC101854768 n=1 Tax=Aplysia californica TaxID=6500 RepID=A0ABM1ADJ1_APLCA|nr:uncharacterized protein LOC101854768 [Aplysia californica]XP_012945626.1 uncharacterized protein LOC101854768 [Aplysia californica]
MGDDYVLKDTTGKVKLENLKINENPRFITYLYPGFGYGVYDRNNLPGIPQLLLYLVESRSSGLYNIKDKNGKGFLDWFDVVKDGTSFVGAAEIEMSRGLYERSLRSSNLEVKVSLGQVGRTSLVVASQLFSPGESTPVVSQVYREVLIDSASRKPAVIPTWFRERFEGKGTLENVPFVVEKFERPTRTFMQSFTISWLDTDANGHTNFTIYPRFAINALHHALFLKSKSLGDRHNKGDETSFQISESLQKSWHGDLSAVDGMSEEIVKCGLKNFKINFINECKQGDTVLTHIWTPDKGKFLIKCSIEKPDGTRLCQIVLEYFGPSSRL